VSARAGSTGPPLILIAEDERPIAEVLTAIVEEAGYTPMVAHHGRQALELARQRWPDLLITDLMMPHLGGDELIAALRQEARTRGQTSIPVILMTAAGPRQARAAGADVVLRKPFDIATLEETIHRLMHPDASDGAAPTSS
jgi:two-component system, chemotaxis family, chemotaxis protein CheY